MNVFTKLRFTKQPKFLNDIQADLDDSHPGSADFLAYRRWIIAKQHGLLATPAVGDNDADGRLRALLKMLESERERLRTLRRVAWHKEMFVAGVIHDESPRQGPVPGPIG